MKLYGVSLLAFAATSTVFLVEFASNAIFDTTEGGIQGGIVGPAVPTGPVKPDRAPGAVLRGVVQVMDGTTIEYVNPPVTVRLAGIESCASAQSACYNGTLWPCGAFATAWLVSQTLGQSVEREVLSRDNTGVVGQCNVRGSDIAAEALCAGQAVVSENIVTSIPRDRYRELEKEAGAARAGIWSSSFFRPQRFPLDRVTQNDVRDRHGARQDQQRAMRD
jgi:endonuclease YncB( thermonuclease family)